MVYASGSIDRTRHSHRSNPCLAPQKVSHSKTSECHCPERAGRSFRGRKWLSLGLEADVRASSQRSRRSLSHILPCVTERRSLVAGGNQHRHSCVAAWKLNEVPVSAAVRCRATQHVSGARVINCHPLSAYSSHCRAGNRGQFPARPAEQRRALELRIANLMSVLICICSHSPAS